MFYDAFSPLSTMPCCLIAVKFFVKASNNDKILHGYNSLNSSSSFVRSQINFYVSLSSVSSIRPAILHHRLSRCVCLITERLFKSCQADCCVHSKCLFLMHRSSAGGSSPNLLNSSFDSSMPYISSSFSSLPLFLTLLVLQIFER
ncbi:hypothetical protein NL108_001288 [Boleophthalmus pectinirostris]|nr:hypothetical protein NL108_001288 [Boleophthalmus pectinirostris]